MNLETEKFLVRAKEFRELAGTIKSEQHRKLLQESAEKLERLATQRLGSDHQR